MLTAVVVVLRSCALICRGHRAVASKAWRFGSGWRCSGAPSSVPRFVIEIDCFGYCSPMHGETGARC
jgi:hypothetical protein